jgi:hypothetical protein
MNTAYHDRVAFSTPFCVVCEDGAAYLPANSRTHAANLAADEVLTGRSAWAAVYEATDSGVAEHQFTYEAETDAS